MLFTHTSPAKKKKKKKTINMSSSIGANTRRWATRWQAKANPQINNNNSDTFN